MTKQNTNNNQITIVNRPFDWHPLRFTDKNKTQKFDLDENNQLIVVYLPPGLLHWEARVQQFSAH